MREHNRDLAVPVEMQMIGRRTVDLLKAGLTTFDDAVCTMKIRQMRREQIMHAAQMLAGQIADEIEDAEGWHGPGRMEAYDERTGGRFKYQMD